MRKYLPLFLLLLLLFTCAASPGIPTKYYVSYTAPDQGLSSRGSFKYLVDSIGSKNATIVFSHTLAATQTTTGYTFNTNETCPSNITVEVEPGAVLTFPTAGINLTQNGPFKAEPTKCLAVFHNATGIILTGKAYPEWWGTDYTALNSAVSSVSNGTIAFSTGTYELTSGVSKTLTGTQGWVCDGPVTIKYTGAKRSYMINLELGGDFSMDGPFTLDCNNLAGCAMRIDNDTTSMDDAVSLYLNNVKAINAYSDVTDRSAYGILMYGAFKQITMDKCGASNVSRASGITAYCGGLVYAHKDITSYAQNVSITDPWIDTITCEETTASAAYIDMDGIVVTGPAADANGGVKMDTTLNVRGGTFINCSGRSIKSQMENNTIDSPTFIRNASGKKATASSQEVDFQYGSGRLVNFNVKYSALSGGGTPFPSSWAVCNASVQNYATEEGDLVVSNGTIINDVAQGTDLLPYFVTIVRTGGTFQSCVVENNTFLGAGAVDQLINTDTGNINLIVANNNYVNDLGTSLIYSSADYSATAVYARGNYLAGTSKKITDGGSAVPQWYGDGNTGFSGTNGARMKYASASIADGGTITHSMGTTPSIVIAVGSVAAEMVSVTAISSTTFTVGIKKHDGSAGTTQTIYWEAFK